MFGVFPMPSSRAEMNLDCTDGQWAAFIKRVEAIGEKEIQAILECQKKGTPAPRPVAETHPGMLYYWQHLMGGGDGS